MALGSFATATNVSPRPTARAPTPMRRKVPDAVPARCPPSVACAPAAHGSSSRSAEASAARKLEVDVKRQPPERARPVVRRIVHLADADEVVHTRDVARIELPLAPHVALA